jgi:hypothetical protein
MRGRCPRRQRAYAGMAASFAVQLSKQSVGNVVIQRFLGSGFLSTREGGAVDAGTTRAFGREGLIGGGSADRSR